MSVNSKYPEFTKIVLADGTVVGPSNALPTTGGGGGGGGGVITDIQDGTGDSIMDAANNAVRVNVVTGATSGGSTETTLAAINTAVGATTDAGVVTDTTGTVIGFLRGSIIKWVSALTQLGIVTEAAPGTDTASSGLNGRLQRIAQRLTSLIALVPAALTGSGNFKVAVAESTASQAVTNANLDVALSTVATQTTLATRLSESDFDTKAGSLTETAPATDTASSGLNGRLQRVAQRLTSLIALLPASLGAKTAAASLAVTLATDDESVALTGAVNETAPASDTASSGLNGRLQRVAQRLTSLIALLPATLVGGRLDVNVGASTSLAVTNANLDAGLSTLATQAGAGATADAKVITDANGSRNAFLRGLVHLFSLVIDTTNNFLRTRAGADVVTLSVNFTRPADTNAYLADDTITDNTTAGSATNLTFTNFARVNASSVTLQRVQVVSTNNPATPPGLELLLFTTAPATSADNAPCAITDAELQGGKFITAVPLVASRPVNPAAGTSGNRVWEATGLNVPMVCAAATRNIIGVLKTTTAYTPISAERFDITIVGIQD